MNGNLTVSELEKVSEVIASTNRIVLSGGKVENA